MSKNRWRAIPRSKTRRLARLRLAFWARSRSHPFAKGWSGRSAASRGAGGRATAERGLRRGDVLGVGAGVGQLPQVPLDVFFVEHTASQITFTHTYVEVPRGLLIRHFDVFLPNDAIGILRRLALSSQCDERRARTKSLFGLADLTFCRGPNIEHGYVETQRLAGQGVIGIDHARVAPDLEHRHRHGVPLVRFGDEFVTDVDFARVRKLTAVDLEHGVGIVQI